MGDNRRTDPGIFPETLCMLLPSPSSAMSMAVFLANMVTTATRIRNQTQIAAAQYTIRRSIGLAPQKGRYIQQ